MGALGYVMENRIPKIEIHNFLSEILEVRCFRIQNFGMLLILYITYYPQQDLSILIKHTSNCAVKYKNVHTRWNF